MNLFIKYKKTVEKLLGLDSNYLVNSGFWVTAKQTSASISALIIPFVFTRLADKEAFGIYNLAISVFVTASVFSLPGVLNAVIEQSARNFDGSLLKGIKIRFYFSVLGGIFLALLGLFYISQNKETVGLIIVLSSFIFPIYFSFSTYDAFLTGKKAFKKQATYYGIFYLISTLIIVTCLVLNLSIILLVLVILTIQALFNLIYSIKTLREVGNQKVEKDFTSFSVINSLVTGLGVISSNIDSVLLGTLIGLPQLAIYSVANLLPDGISKNLRNYFAIYTVKLIPHKPHRKREITKKFYFRLILLGVFIFITFYALIPFLIQILFPKSYLEAIFYSRLLGLAFFFLPINTTLSAIITFEKKSFEILTANLIQNASRLSLLFILIPIWGILGIVISTLLSNLLVFVCLNYLIFFKKT